MRGDWQMVSRLAKSKNIKPVCPDHEPAELADTVRPDREPVESIEELSLTNSPNTVRPELVEGHSLCEQLKSRITDARQHQQKLADVLVEQALID